MRASITARPSRRLIGRLALLPLALALSGLIAPPALAAGNLSITTSYPAIVVAPGANVVFDLKVKTSSPARVDLKVLGAPSGWDTKLQGGGFVVDAVETDGNTATDVTLNVTVPEDATGSTHLTVRASGLGQTDDLGLDVRVSTSGGELTLTTDVASLKDTATATFNFQLVLHNDTPQDQTYVVAANGPTGWTTSVRQNGQSQAASSTVKAANTSSIGVTAEPPDGIAAGQYEVDVVVTAGDKQLTQKLNIEVTGSYTMSMSTPTQVLSGRGTAGATTEQQLTISNDGSGEITNVKVTATFPTNWKVEFDNDTVASIAAGQTATVTAKITPSGDAIAGDYLLTFRASNDQSTTTSEQIRFTVETSILWAIVGILLIAAVFGGLWWVFRRYGRR